MGAWYKPQKYTLQLSTTVFVPLQFELLLK